MIVKTDKNLNVLYAEQGEYQKSGKENHYILWKASIVGKVNGELKLLKYNNFNFSKDLAAKDINDNTLAELVGSYAILKIEDNKLVFAGTDLCAAERIYEYRDTQHIYLFSSLYEFLNVCKPDDLIMNENRYEYYLAHGYSRGESTYIERLKKLSPGVVYYYQPERKVDLLDVFRINRTCDYTCYKELLFECLEMVSDNRKLYIMHSGGVDSNLLLCIAQALHKEIELLTYEYCEPSQMDSNLADVQRSRKIAEVRQARHRVVPMHFEQYEKYLENTGLFEKMPLEAHKTSGAVFNLFQTLAKENGNKKYLVLCGQNNDSLYNLGPTEIFTMNILKVKNFKRGLQGVCQRVLISDFYAETLEGRHKVRKKLIDTFVKSIFYLRYHQKFEEAHNLQELINYFLNSEGYLAMKKPGEEYEMHTYGEVTPDTLRKVLFKEKLRGFVDGNDNKVIKSCADLNDAEVCLPYSLQPLVYFYYHMALTKRDIFHPKDLCYRLVKELGMNKKIFKTKYQTNVDKGMQWDNKLKKTFSTNQEEWNFQQVIGQRWAEGILAYLKKKEECENVYK